MNLFEQSRELQLLSEALTGSAKDPGRLVLITGGPGSGKTELLHEFLTVVERSGIRSLSKTGCSASRQLPLNVFRTLFRISDLSCPALELIPISDTEAEGFQLRPAAQRRKLLDEAIDAVVATLIALADECGQLVLTIDDAHTMDAASLRVLTSLLQAARGRSLLVVCTSTRQRTADHDTHAVLIRTPHRRVRMRPMSASGVAAVVRDQAGARVPAKVCSAYHHASAGNPLLLQALLDDGVRQGPELGMPVMGPEYRESVVSFLHRTDPRHRRTLEALAALHGTGVTLPLATLLRMQDNRVQESVDQWNSVGLLDGRDFRQPAVPAVVLDEMSADGRRQLHRSIADLLHERGAPPSAIAPHLMDTGAVTAVWDAGVLRSAAEEALGADDLETCTAYLKLVLQHCDTAPERHSVAVLLARAEWRRNPSAAGIHLRPLRAAALNDELAMRETAVVLRHMLWQGDTELAAKGVAALVRTHSPADEQVLSEVEFIRQWFYGVAMPGIIGVDKLDAQRGSVAGDVTGLGAKVTALVDGDDTDDSIAAVTQALQGHRLDQLNLEMVAMALLAVANAGKPATADAVCATLLDHARARNAVTWQALLGSVQAEIALLQGDLIRAAELAETSLAMMHDLSWGVVIGLPLSTIIFARTGLGEHESTVDLLKRDVPEMMFRTVFGIQYLRARAYHYLATDQPFAALSEFETCSRLMREGNPSLQRGIPWRTDLAWANLQIGNTATAKSLAEQQLRLPGGYSARARAMTLRVLAAASKPHRRAALLHEAIDLLESSGDRRELAQAFADLSTTHYELGEFARARLVAQQATEEARRCRIETRVDRRMLVTPMPLPDDPEPAIKPILSDSETRVAGLAALGYTNREISMRIHVTISTVEQHLTRVYRKLKVGSRAQLPSKMLEFRIPAMTDQRVGDRPSPV